MNRSISGRPEPPEGPRIGPDLDLAPTMPRPLLLPLFPHVQSPHALPYASEWIPTAFGPIVLPAPGRLAGGGRRGLAGGGRRPAGSAAPQSGGTQAGGSFGFIKL
ncbi:uncharacterized protein BDR25DRAFT_395353 [Lindgomyces ingoldianus]|uniref:Uncharacterized protein n=1 Tax=Lindgomyces ingoldianus TaxID=673940 RepID=A0ACB6QJV7_9PLEO|nr:uncharacterized protein BDR25DRAFT_395353 [Lindgomyces ingoldianus]KAF2467223.1 hypothetical protein BDR25DRAFT_395353 [Lindgomyces ingoldianus]